ncbi:MAG: J domain-containing protein, partial [Synergistaceae bacterium]|nr:J domain-containing protein [Synergistaceae bacterium]
MNENLDYFYEILGLRRGATTNEIKAAYRQLVKLYHPDRDQSHDAEIMYKEIHLAYKALLEQPFTSETSREAVDNRNSPERTTRTSEELEFWENWNRECYDKTAKITFSWVLKRFIVSLISFFLYGPTLALIYFDVPKGDIYLDTPIYEIWIAENLSYIIVTSGILISIIITWGVFFLVSNKIMSKGLAIRITCFCPFTLS